MLMNRPEYCFAALYPVLVGAVAAVAAAIPVMGHAQEMPLLTADIGVGLGHGAGGPPTEKRGLFVFTAQFAVAALRSTSSAVIVAADQSLHFRPQWPLGAACFRDAVPPCTDHPGALSQSLLIGWGRTTESAHTLRVLVGPARVGIDGQVGAGALARVDWALPATPHGDWVLLGQTLVTPEWKGRRYTIISGGVGFRLGTYRRETRRSPGPRPPPWRWPPLTSSPE
jgi:hypothetical protein